MALVVELVLGAVDVAQRGSHTGSFCTATRRTDTYRGRKQPLSFELLELATGERLREMDVVPRSEHCPTLSTAEHCHWRGAMSSTACR